MKATHTPLHDPQGFRFQTGSIKRHTAPTQLHKRGSSFDSKLVRLKGRRDYCGNPHGSMFRFQTGSIKSPTLCRARRLSSEFRFQTGSIKRLRLMMIMFICTSFDSKLVRLKVGGKDRKVIAVFVSIPNWFD